jgi:hypothetical protein
VQLENGAMQPLPLALVAPHQAGVADNVSSEDRRQFSLLTGKWNLPALLQRIARGLDRHVRFGVSRVGLTSCPSRPLYPEHRTFPDAVATSHLCQLLSNSNIKHPSRRAFGHYCQSARRLSTSP